MKNTNTRFPLKKDRVTILEEHLNGTDAIPAKEQVLYGDESCGITDDWQDEPRRERELKTYSDAGYLVRKTSKNGNGPWKIHSIVVQSHRIMEILRCSLDGYPGVSPALDTMTLFSPFESMFHRWDEFCRAIESADEKVKRHIDGFFRIFEKELKPHFKILQDANKHGVIEHDHLWTIFGPNELIWWDIKQNHSIGRVLYTKKVSKGSFEIHCKQIVWDGFTLQDEECVLCICPFTGSRPVAEMYVVPLSRKPDGTTIKEVVLQRGKKFLALAGCHYRIFVWIYRQFIQLHRHFIRSGHYREYLGLGLVKRQHKEDYDEEAQDRPQWDGVRNRQESQAIDPASKDDSECLIYSPLVKGYSLTKKKWYKLFVSNISDITWDNSFDRLVLGSDEKELLLGFAETKLHRSTEFDDFVSGKGNGVIILLAGPPGVGKTLTAESIADQMRVPLYPLSAGELGTSPEKVENRLYQALTLCQEWDAVLLLDEADVFLETRSTSNLQRNELASIFLRLLEYFKGLMFLTTNRRDSIDPAFQSRIDLTIGYDDLAEDSRFGIWKNFIGENANFQGAGESKLRDLASHEMNGRQIKNVVKLAGMLATRRKQSLDSTHLNAILKMYEQN
ncbi:hypothetical protein M434DRAFT_384647 [Hypoxylon sp. CO27-5]|nr:hypothetical protein M434DRAFT_384647 [Hypoxylon sp. CO27-5]